MADKLGTTVVGEEEWRSILQEKGSQQEWKSAIEELKAIAQDHIQRMQDLGEVADTEVVRSAKIVQGRST